MNSGNNTTFAEKNQENYGNTYTFYFLKNIYLFFIRSDYIGTVHLNLALKSKWSRHPIPSPWPEKV